MFALNLGRPYQSWARAQKGRRMLNVDEELAIFLHWRSKMGRECYPERKRLYCPEAGNNEPTF